MNPLTRSRLTMAAGFVAFGAVGRALLASDETSFGQGFGAEVGTQVGNEVQAFMPIDQLCPLANHDAVPAARPAAQASP